MQSGAETGIYVRDRIVNNIEHYIVSDTLPMTLSLYNVTDEKTETVFNWAPNKNEEQWWITGFNPKFDNPDPNVMQMICSINFKDKSMYQAVKQSCKKNNQYNTAKFIFDDDYKTLWLTW